MHGSEASQTGKDWSVEAKKAARLVWENDGIEHAPDPREPIFACTLITELSALLHGTSRVVRRVMERAASAAEDLNVEPYQGLIEIIQNADDLAASEVRFAVREDGERRQLLVVHNGKRRDLQHVGHRRSLSRDR